MHYWLMKSEPDTFGIDDLERVGREPWDGIRNYQARNFMRDGMQPGDLALFYHSNADPTGVAGIMRIASQAKPDPTAFDPEAKYYDPKSVPEAPRWQLVEVAFERKLRRVITLAELRTRPELADMPLLRKGQRLSILPVDERHWQAILALE
ncbi:EVE domain-containing protein [Acidihalobacter yilgarnensis]|uniref:EVE domain-containing protein n=1 Tax=Acidihalobacter yilgarnensis TaxID=2819280 RepID=A0A1D8IKB3_9GAMM|nr:EVE domain-containing protein [Acidihalobacter yilgarnensis]AOU96898.1 EVE domain-containing protein [Acidihalobacter yilgarnensis]